MESNFKWTKYLFLIFFAVFIWGYSLVDVFYPAREYSEMENRYLQQNPKFTISSLFDNVDNSYTQKVEKFTNDQFMLRDNWITLKSICETVLAKIENNGIAYGKDNYMFEKRLTIDSEQLEKNTNALVQFAQKFPEESMTLALVPTSDMVLTDKLPKGLHNIDQLPLIQSVYDRAAMKTLDVYTELKNYNSMDYTGQIYYRTDHHWTTKGAYIAYRSYADSLELKFASIPGPDSGELKDSEPGTRTANETPNFYGTYYSKAKLFSAVPDTIEWYDIPVKSVTINGEAADGLYDMEKFNVRDKYAAFLHSNNGVTVIESDCNQNHKDGETSRVLVFKDSFGNCFSPFLCYSFDEVTVVDLRYFTKVEKLVAEGGFDEILFLYSFPTFAQETSMVNLKM